MKAYIIKVASAALLSALCDVVTPKGWQKYVNILTNAILLLVLISPLLSLKSIDIPSFEKEDAQIIEYDVESEIFADLKTRIEKDIEDRLKTEFNFSSKATVTLNTTNTKNVRVKEIKLFPKASEEIKNRLYHIYECESVD